MIGGRAALLAWMAAAALLWPAPAQADETLPRELVEPTETSRPTARLERRPSLYCDPPTFCRGGPPVYGYDGSFFLRNQRERFSFRPSAYVQLRWTRNERTQTRPGESRRTQDLELVRTRVNLEGDLTPTFSYGFQVDIDSTGDVAVLDASLTWNMNKQWSLTAGQLFLAVQREDWANPVDTLTTDYSANDLVFAPGVGRGAQVQWQATRDRAWLSFSDGRYQGGNSLVGETRNATWAFTGRYEHQFCTTDWSLWSDLVGRRGRPRGVLLGIAGGLGEGNERSDVDREFLLTVDASLGWNGGQGLLFGNFRHSENRDGSKVSIYGLVAQAGQFLTRTVQLYGRYDLVAPGDTPGNLVAYHSWTAGLSYLPFRWTNRYKLAAEVSYLSSPLNRTIVPTGSGLGFLPSDEDQFYVRLQCQFGF